MATSCNLQLPGINSRGRLLKDCHQEMCSGLTAKYDQINVILEVTAEALPSLFYSNFSRCNNKKKIKTQGCAQLRSYKGGGAQSAGPCTPTLGHFARGDKELLPNIFELRRL